MKSTIYLFAILLCVFYFSNTTQAQLNEGFEGNFPPLGWVVFDNGVQPKESWEKSTKNASAGSAHALVKFSSSNVELAEDWLVTPKLLPDVGNSMLSFQATNDYASSTGSVYTVRVSSTSQTDRSTFVTEWTRTEDDFTHDVYQGFSVDLSAYIGQEIYVAFVLENSRGDNFLVDDVTGPPAAPIASVPNCDVALIEPDPETWDDVPINASLGWTAASGDPTGYKIQIGTSQGGDEFLSLTDNGPGTTYQPAMDFDFDTRYYVTIVAYNANGDAAECQEIEFTTMINSAVDLDCGGATASVMGSLCYDNLEVKSFLLTANNGSEVNITFHSGTVENNQDEVYIYDGADDTGTLLNDGKLFGNAGDFSGLSYTSTTGNLFIRIISDGSNSCKSGEQSELQYTVSCADCVPPSATASAGLCDVMNNEFYIDLDVISYGSDSLLLTNDQNGLFQMISTTGLMSIGPFEFGSVKLYLFASDAECLVELPAVTVGGCAPANDSCHNALTIVESVDSTCSNKVSGTTFFSTTNIDTASCASDVADVWYSFVPNDSADYMIDLSSVAGLVSYAVYSGTCGDITLVDETCDIDSSSIVSLLGGEHYMIQVYSIDNDLFADSFDLCLWSTNDFPLAVDDDTLTQKNVPLAIPVTTNDKFGKDGPSNQSITITTQGSNGSAVVEDSGTSNDPTDDVIVYSPNAGYLGMDTVIYRICDGNGDCDEAMLVITVEVFCEPDYANDNSLSGMTSANLITDYEAVGLISSSQLVDIDADYDSASEIELLPGFEVLMGVTFDAFIDGCDNGGGGNQ